jgi:hypothetical protein
LSQIEPTDKALVLATHLSVLTIDLPEKLTIINLRDNSLVTFTQFHASCMNLILGLTEPELSINELENMYELNPNTCQRELRVLISYLLEKGILTRISDS